MNSFMLFIVVGLIIAIILLGLGFYLIMSKKDINDTENQKLNQPHKKNSVPVWVYILVTIIIVGGFCLLLFPGDEITTNNSSVTMAEYNQVQTGMSYSQVSNIIGGQGEEMSRVEMAGYLTIMYMWNNFDGSNMNAMFQNDELVSKAQFGLK